MRHFLIWLTPDCSGELNFRCDGCWSTTNFLREYCSGWNIRISSLRIAVCFGEWNFSLRIDSNIFIYTLGNKNMENGYTFIEIKEQHGF